jgi:hypothetical protein
MAEAQEFTKALAERLAIQQAIGDWAFFRDGGEWDSLRQVFASDGFMTTNGGTTSADDFVAYARSLRERGVLSHHFMGRSRVRLSGARAVSETQAQLMIRSSVGEVAVDITVLLRYLDRFVVEDGAWRIQDRRPIFIKDRVDPVLPGTSIEVDQAVLEECPEGCRYLVYLGRAAGAPHNPIERATFNTPFADSHYAGADAWLAA